jgi:hypothetical protein
MADRGRLNPGRRDPEGFPCKPDSSGTLMRVTASYNSLQSRQTMVWTEKLKARSARPETLVR